MHMQWVEGKPTASFLNRWGDGAGGSIFFRSEIVMLPGFLSLLCDVGCEDFLKMRSGISTLS